MPGFAVNNMGLRTALRNYDDSACVQDGMAFGPYFAARNVLCKFMDDKLFYEDDEVVLITDGVIYNRLALMEKHRAGGFAQAVKAMALAAPGDFFGEFRGSFSGALYLKKSDEWYIYTNHIGDHMVLYYHDGERFMAGSQPNYLLDALREGGVALHLDGKAVLDMLSFAFMERDNTYAEEIKRLPPGCVLHVAPGVFEVKRYYELRRDNYDATGLGYDDAIEVLDELFRAAVKLEYDKDAEYGYAHRASMSGGLDARMNNWVAKALGYGPVLNMTFGQSGCLDIKLARKMSAYLGHQLVVMPSDDAGFMLDLDEVVRAGYGISSYGMLAAGLRDTKVLNTPRYGANHTGQVGDAVVGSFFTSRDDVADTGISGNFSRKLKHLIAGEYRATFADKELYMFYTRGFNGACASHVLGQNFTEVASPFLAPELLDFCLALPVEWRIGHKLYKDWVLRKYPDAARFKWEKTNSKLSAPKWWGKLKMYLVHYPGIVLNVLGFGVASGMAPHNYWYRTKPEIQRFFDEYYASHINHSMLTEELRGHITYLFENGYTNEKEQALTALAAVWYYFPQG